MPLCRLPFIPRRPSAISGLSSGANIYGYEPVDFSGCDSSQSPQDDDDDDVDDDDEEEEGGGGGDQAIRAQVVLAGLRR